MTQFGGAGGSFGPNAWLVDDMYDRFLADPDSVSESWREFFADYRPAPVPLPQSQATTADVAVPSANGSATPAVTPTAPAAPAALATVASAPAAARGGGEEATVLRGAASRIVANMEAS